MTKKTKTTKQIVVKKPKRPQQQIARMGPVTSIDTAPVAIGNSIRGSETKVLMTSKDATVVTGRDFMFAPIGTGSVTTWTLAGGSPLSPAAFADTSIANYMRMYSKFRFKDIVVHYITSSPTSANGDVMFYYGKDRSSVFLNQTSPQLLGFVLSDESTVLGPQWTNHSARMKVTGDWKLTDYGMHDGIESYADGELFLLSKTSTTDSPGYVVFDYTIEFAEHQLQPRLLEFPIPRIQFSQTNLGKTSAAVNDGVAVSGALGWAVKGNNISGSSAVVPSGAVAGDVYKMILDVTNSAPGSWSGCSASNLLKIRYDTGGYSTVITVVDGMTLYAVYTGSTFDVYTNPTAAFAANGSATALCYSIDATASFNLQVWLSYIGSVGLKNLIPNY